MYIIIINLAILIGKFTYISYIFLILSLLTPYIKYFQFSLFIEVLVFIY
jgi:hypothetical protein